MSLILSSGGSGPGVNTQNPGGLVIVNTNSYKITGVPSPVKGKYKSVFVY